MLSRTADHLFWLSRYTERAENTARMLDVTHQASLLPRSDELVRQGWAGLLSISELKPAFTAQYGPELLPRDVMHFMVRDEKNPSSIVACLRNARENARAVRGTLTTEVWETLNQTYLEVMRLLQQTDLAHDPAPFFEWVKFRSHLSRGVTSGTMLQDEALHFLQLGTFLERADNTARLIDVKFHAGDDTALVGPAPEQASDFYHWSAILRSVSAFEIYRKVYRDVIRPERVAELLILRADMPRSLLACLNGLMLHLAHVTHDPSSSSERCAGKLRAELQYSRIEDILDTGLHAFLTQFLDRVNTLGAHISREFLVPDAQQGQP